MFGRKGKLQVDFGDLTEQLQHLSGFLFKPELTFVWGKLTLTSGEVQPKELQRPIANSSTKGITTAGIRVSLNEGTVKIGRFKEENKHGKQNKNPLQLK